MSIIEDVRVQLKKTYGAHLGDAREALVEQLEQDFGPSASAVTVTYRPELTRMDPWYGEDRDRLNYYFELTTPTSRKSVLARVDWNGAMSPDNRANFDCYIWERPSILQALGFGVRRGRGAITLLRAAKRLSV